MVDLLKLTWSIVTARTLNTEVERGVLEIVQSLVKEHSTNQLGGRNISRKKVNLLVSALLPLVSYS